MREAIAILALILLISVGWNQRFADHYANLAGEPATPSPSTTPMPNAGATPGQFNATKPAAPPRDTSWMWRKTKMDQPYDKTNSHGR
jgi:hypothetical protein